MEVNDGCHNLFVYILVIIVVDAQTNKEAHLELFRVFLALHLVEFQCFGGHFENEYQVCFKSLILVGF